MPIIIRCSECRRRLQITNDMLGKRIKCPLCKNVIVAEPSVSPVAKPTAPSPSKTVPRRRPAAVEFEEVKDEADFEVVEDEPAADLGAVQQEAVDWEVMEEPAAQFEGLEKEPKTRPTLPPRKPRPQNDQDISEKPAALRKAPPVMKNELQIAEEGPRLRKARRKQRTVSRKWFILALVGGGLGLLLIAGVAVGVISYLNRGPEWTEFEPTDGHLKVKMPGIAEPKQVINVERFSAREFGVTLDKPKVYFAITFGEMPLDEALTDTVFETFMKLFADYQKKHLNLDITRETDMSFREFHLESPGKKGMGIQRVFLVRRHHAPHVCTLGVRPRGSTQPRRSKKVLRLLSDY